MISLHSGSAPSVLWTGHLSTNTYVKGSKKSREDAYTVSVLREACYREGAHPNLNL